MIARKRASYTHTPIGSPAHEENCQQFHDPALQLLRECTQAALVWKLRHFSSGSVAKPMIRTWLATKAINQ